MLARLFGGRKRPSNKRMLLIGNGPSTRQLAEYGFHNIPDDFDTFGMGAAYRYFHLIGWWPTYYAWCDMKVVQSHRAALASLTTDRDVTCERFFFSLPVSKSRRFEQVPHSSTGDFCFKKCLELGYDEIYMIGVEGSYVEEIGNSVELTDAELNALFKAIPEAGRKRLKGTRRITANTLGSDNYFFPWYQMKDDVYSLPRSNLHQTFWEACSAQAKSHGIKVFNLSDSSRVGGFNHLSLDEALPSPGVKYSLPAASVADASEAKKVALLAFPTLRTEAEREFWANVSADLRKRGYRPVIFSYYVRSTKDNVKVDFAEQYFVDMNAITSTNEWRDRLNPEKLSKALRNLAANSSVTGFVRTRAKKFDVRRAKELHNCAINKVRTLQSLISSVQPSAIVLTNDTHNAALIVEEIAREKSIPLFHVERSPLVSNWIEKEGFYAESEAWDSGREWLSDESLDGVGAAVIERLSANPAMHRASEGNGGSEDNQENHRPHRDGRQQILIALDAVFNTGWVIPGHPKRALNYPMFETPEKAIRAIAEAAKPLDVDIVVKLHPNLLPYEGVKEIEGVRIINGDLDTALQTADLVICFLSKVAFSALACRKNLLLLAPNIATLSGAATSCNAIEDLEESLAEALRREWDSRDDEKVRRFFGWLERDYFLPNSADSDRAKAILETYFPDRPTGLPGNTESTEMSKLVASTPRVIEFDSPTVEPADRRPGSLLGPFPRAAEQSIEEVDVVLDLFRKQVLRPQEERGLMLDIGACKGVAFKPFAALGWEVHAFEPNPPMHAFIVANNLVPGVTLNQLAVSEKSGEELPFYTSEESLGISSLSPFRDTHVPTAIVKTIRLDDYCSSRGLERADFVKIDTEGFDLMVLKSHDWARFKPAVIITEFEDLKTNKLGYAADDVAAFLSDRGYTVYTSEWHPITRYGGMEHRWMAFYRWQAGILPSTSWGNFIAFREPIDEAALMDSVRRAADDGQAKLSRNLARARARVSAASSTPGHMKKSQSDRASQHPSESLDDEARPFYADFAERLMVHSPGLFRVLQRARRSLAGEYGQSNAGGSGQRSIAFRVTQMLAWIARSAMRHKVSTLLLLVICLVLVTVPLLGPDQWPWRYFTWTIAAGLVGLAMAGAVMREAVRRILNAQHVETRAALRNTQRSTNTSVDSVKKRLEGLIQHQRESTSEIADRVSRVEQSFAVSQQEFDEKAAALQSELRDTSATRGREVTELSATLKLMNDLPNAVDVVSGLRALRPLLFGESAVDALKHRADAEHGHAVLMAVMADEARGRPDFLLGKTLIEIGTTRERDPNQSSTQKLAIFTGLMEMQFLTVDMDNANTEAARSYLRMFNPKAQAITARGEEYLGRYAGALDFVYLDAFDFDHGKHSAERQARYQQNLYTTINDFECWKMHEACARVIAERMPVGGLVVIDDTWDDADGNFAGKGKLAVPLLLGAGFEIVFRTRMTVAMKRTSQ